MDICNKIEINGYRDKITKVKENKGVIVFAEGGVFEGHFEKGNMKGQGRQIFETLDVSEGCMVDGKIVGQGKFTYCDGRYYEGDFVDGKPEGKGREVLADCTYEGYFANGLYDGEGTLTVGGSIVFQGSFKCGKLDGNAKMYSLNSKKSYDGEFKEGKYHGHGISVSENGDRYEGPFLNGKRHGKGSLMTYTIIRFLIIFIRAKGILYEGQFVDGVLEGTVNVAIPGKPSFELDYIKGSPKKKE